MTVPAAVALIRQVQSLTENPELLKANDCVEQVAYFLDCFLDHAESRARMGAARTLAQLTARLSRDERCRLELRQARRVLERMEAEQCSDADAEAVELHSLIKSMLGDEGIQCPSNSHGMPEGNGENTRRDGGDEIHIRVYVDLDEQRRASIRRSLIDIFGVVSITFESRRIVVRARTRELAKDAVLIEDICRTVEEQLRHAVGVGHQKLLVEPVLATTKLLDDDDEDSSSSDSEDEPRYANDDDDGDISPSAQIKLVSGAEASSDDDEPLYLDDSEEEEAVEGCGTHYSFFGQRGWLYLTQRRIQQYEQEDPTLVARLRRAHLRSERRKREEEGRLRRLLAVITPLRTQAQR